MTADGSTADHVLKNRLARSRSAAASVAGGVVERAWDMALRRSAQDMLALRVDVQACRMRRLSLTELLELPGARSLIGVLDGPGEGMGIIVLSPDVLSGLVEVQTIGRVSTHPPLARKATRTDAAMVAGFLDAALVDMEAALAGLPELIWAGGYRYASFLDDPRPLALMLEDAHWQVLEVDLALAGGVKSGHVLLALPANGRPAGAPGMADAVNALDAAFADGLHQQLCQVECRMDAVMVRISLDLSELMALGIDDVLALTGASLDLVQLETPNGRRLASGRLGQARGMRALRLTHVDSDTPAMAPEPQDATAGAIAQPRCDAGGGEAIADVRPGD